MNLAGSDGGGNAFDFSSFDLYQLSEMVDADHARLVTLRGQAEGWRRAAALADAQRGRLDESLTSTRSEWSGAGATTFTDESGRVTKSMSDSFYTFEGNANAVGRIADEAEAVKADIDEIKADWEHVKAAYAADRHVFDGASDVYRDGYQYMTNVLQPTYVQEARERMNLAANTYQTAWYSGLHEPKPYDGPTVAPEPKHGLDSPTHWLGSGGAPAYQGGGYGGSPASSAPPPPASPAPPPPAPAPIVPAQPDGPRTEFPSPAPAPPGTAPGPPPAVPPGTPPSVVGGGPLPPLTPPGYLPGVPGPLGARPPVAGRPGLFGPGGGPNTARATRPVIGGRPGAGTPAARAGARGPRAAMPERGVIRNPDRAGAAAKAKANPRETLANLKAERRKRRDELDRRIGRTGGQEDLFAVTALAVDAVVRPEVPGKVRRSDAGPAIGRTRG